MVAPASAVRRLAGAIDRLIEVLAGAAVVLLLLCVALGVVTRAWGDPLAWTDEMARFLMVWLAALGWMLACRRGIHVRIRYFQDKLPGPAHRSVEAIIQAAQLVLGLVVAGSGIELVGRNWDLEATTVPLSMGWMYLPLVPAGLVLAAQAAADLIAQAASSVRARPAMLPARRDRAADSAIE